MNGGKKTYNLKKKNGKTSIKRTPKRIGLVVLPLPRLRRDVVVVGPVVEAVVVDLAKADEDVVNLEEAAEVEAVVVVVDEVVLLLPRQKKLKQKNHRLLPQRRSLPINLLQQLPEPRQLPKYVHPRELGGKSNL
jgi:hypothetical protein